MNKQAPPQLSMHRFFIPHLVQDLGRLLENLAMAAMAWNLRGLNDL